MYSVSAFYRVWKREKKIYSDQMRERIQKEIDSAIKERTKASVLNTQLSIIGEDLYFCNYLEYDKEWTFETLTDNPELKEDRDGTTVIVSVVYQGEIENEELQAYLKGIFGKYTKTLTMLFVQAKNDYDERVLRVYPLEWSQLLAKKQDNQLTDEEKEKYSIENIIVYTNNDNRVIKEMERNLVSAKAVCI